MTYLVTICSDMYDAGGGWETIYMQSKDLICIHIQFDMLNMAHQNLIHHHK